MGLEHINIYLDALVGIISRKTIHTHVDNFIGFMLSVNNLNVNYV